jgi:hypothetical protein
MMVEKPEAVACAGQMKKPPAHSAEGFFFHD